MLLGRSKAYITDAIDDYFCSGFASRCNAQVCRDWPKLSALMEIKILELGLECQDFENNQIQHELNVKGNEVPEALSANWGRVVERLGPLLPFFLTLCAVQGECSLQNDVLGSLTGDGVLSPSLTLSIIQRFLVCPQVWIICSKQTWQPQKGNWSLSCNC